MQISLLFFIVILVLAFVCAAGAVYIVVKSESLSLRINSYYKQERRIRSLSASKKDLAKEQKAAQHSIFDQFEGTPPTFPQLAILLDRAGIPADSNVFFAKWVAIALIAVVIAWLFGGTIGAIAALVLGGAAPICVLTFLKNRRENLFTKQLCDALPRIASALVSGGSTFESAVSSIAENSSDPLGSEFTRLKNAISIGMPIEDAIYDMGKRMESKDVPLVAQSIEIQKRTGGALSEILGHIAVTIRERIAMRAKIKAITAESKMSSYIAIGAPILIFFFMTNGNEMYHHYFFETDMGHFCMAAIVVLDVAGFFIMRKIYNMPVD